MWLGPQCSKTYTNQKWWRLFLHKSESPLGTERKCLDGFVSCLRKPSEFERQYVNLKDRQRDWSRQLKNQLNLCNIVPCHKVPGTYMKMWRVIYWVTKFKTEISVAKSHHVIISFRSYDSACLGLLLASSSELGEETGYQNGWALVTPRTKTAQASFVGSGLCAIDSW